MIRLINVDSYRSSIDGYARELRDLAPYSPHFEFRTFRTEQELVDGCAEADIILVEHPDTPINARVIQASGIDSPGLTSCLAVGERVAAIWADGR